MNQLFSIYNASGEFLFNQNGYSETGALKLARLTDKFRCSESAYARLSTGFVELSAILNSKVKENQLTLQNLNQ